MFLLFYYYYDNLNPCSFDTGMLCAGLSETKVSKLFAVLNIPPVNHRHMKKWEREIGGHIEEMAAKSCETAIESGRN